MQRTAAAPPLAERQTADEKRSNIGGGKRRRENTPRVFTTLGTSETSTSTLCCKRRRLRGVRRCLGKRCGCCLSSRQQSLLNNNNSNSNSRGVRSGRRPYLPSPLHCLGPCLSTAATVQVPLRYQQCQRLCLCPLFLLLRFPSLCSADNCYIRFRANAFLPQPRPMRPSDATRSDWRKSLGRCSGSSAVCGHCPTATVIQLCFPNSKSYPSQQLLLPTKRCSSTLLRTSKVSGSSITSTPTSSSCMCPPARLLFNQRQPQPRPTQLLPQLATTATAPRPALESSQGGAATALLRQQTRRCSRRLAQRPPIRPLRSPRVCRRGAVGSHRGPAVAEEGLVLPQPRPQS